MPTRRPTPEHQEAVSRRLALLSAELAGSSPPAPPAPPPELPPEPPVVPVPGRHAARRASALLPATLRGRSALGSAQLAVVAVLVALGLAVTCWWLVRGDADRLEAPAMTPVAAPTTGGASDLGSGVASGAASGVGLVDPSPVAGAETVTVDVTGKVRRPGIVVLDAGTRVVDALEAAGGARPGVDLSGLNLARVLVDGEQVLVGVPAPAGVAAAAATGAPGGPLVNLNTATQVELEALPEVGPVTALAILSWRDEHGGFTTVDELLEVDGIGDATLARIAPQVTV